MMKSILLIILLTVHPLLALQWDRWVVKPKYDSVQTFSEGVAAVKGNDKWGYVDSNGKEILSPAYEFAYPFSEGIGLLTTADHTLLAIVDKTGKLTPIKEKLKIDSRFAIFSDGLLLVYNGRKWGFLNKEGKLAIECKYASAQPFSEGLAAVLLSEYWYYIDTNGATGVRPGDRREIYWAMGFHEGKAAILYKNGMGYMDRNGRELNDKFPQMTPPPDAASYKKPSLALKEGELHFDAKSRITSFVNKKGEETNFMPTKTNDNQPDVRKAPNSKFGVVASGDAPVARLSLRADTVESVLGNPASLSYTLTNTSASAMEELEMKVNGKPVVLPPIAAGETAMLSLSLDKTNEEKTELKELLFSLSEYGLPVGEYREKVVLKNAPAIEIIIPQEAVSVKRGQNSYPLRIQLINRSSVDVSDLAISVGNQKRSINLKGRETEELIFQVPASVQLVNISVKPPRTALISETKRIRIIEEPQTNEIAPDTTGLSKQIITQ
jgi:hypothetical protein